MDWPELFAGALQHRARSEIGLTKEEVGAALRLAREVAHRTERRFAPLATFVAGKFVAQRQGDGVPPIEAVQECLRMAEELLPPPEEPAADRIP